MRNVPHLIRCPIYKPRKQRLWIKTIFQLTIFKVWTDKGFLLFSTAQKALTNFFYNSTGQFKTKLTKC